MAENRVRRGEAEHSVVDDRGHQYIRMRHRFPATATGFLIAPVLWMLYFVAVYSVQGAGCAAGLDQARAAGTDWLQLVLGLMTAVVAGAILGTGIWSFLAWRKLLRDLDHAEGHLHGQATFLAYGALLHAGLFLIATLWSGVPILLVDACDNLGSA